MENIMRLLALFAIAVGLCYAQRTDGSFERTLNVTGFADLELTTDAGGIDVVPGPAGTIRIRGILKAEDNWFRRREDVESRIRELEAHPPIVQNGNSIRVEVRDRSLLRGISMRLEVETPRDSRLRARADSGGIDVRGIKGPVDCHTDSGGIHASEIDSEVRATADSGGIHIRRVNGPVYARADSGGIEAVEVSGSIDAGADSGGIRVSQTATAPIKARSDSGGADITLARMGGYDIQAHAGSGRVTVPDVTVSGRISRHEVNGKLRGGGALVDVRTDSGPIDIR
jgi:Putative adhesin